LDGLAKSSVGGMFITGESVPAAMRITGDDGDGGIELVQGMDLEGRNQSQPSYGAILRIDGAVRVVIHSLYVGFAMASPNHSGLAAVGRQNVEKGIIHVSGGAKVD